MTDTITIALAQLNPTVGDITGNLAGLISAHAQAAARGAGLVVAGELAILGYPAEDLVLKAAAVDDCHAAIQQLAAATKDGPAMIVGTPWRIDDGGPGCRTGVANAVVVLDGGAILAVVAKHQLPNYDVFDEKRVFCPGPLPAPVTVRGVRLGIAICEDIWIEGVCEALAGAGAEILIVPNGSPYRRGVTGRRLDVARARVAATGLPMIYVNQVGGQDELVFDGNSFAMEAGGTVCATLPSFEEKVAVTGWTREAAGFVCASGGMARQLDGDASDYAAMVLALRDYVNKNRFPGVVLGMSGGIDSALSAAVATDALGPDRVHCVMMPTGYTSSDSLDDAAACSAALGVRHDTIPIGPAVDAFSTMLAGQFAGMAPDTTEENIQSRVRAVTLMALSNKFGSMVLTTGNKSEMAVGYATLYGDMCGGYNVLKDLYKMEVYRLSAWRNAHTLDIGLGPSGMVIPERILTKAPSAELRPDQTDQDSLPPYPALDDMLHGFVEDEAEIDAVIARGHDRATVERIQHLLYIAEYKRRQAPPGVKISHKNFGRDRRYPITNRYRDKAGD